MEHATPAVTVTARRDGFHRCGVPHPASPVEYPAGHWSEEQLERLRAEPMLVVADTAGEVQKILKHLSEDPKKFAEIGAAAGRRSRLVAAAPGSIPTTPITSPGRASPGSGRWKPPAA